MCVSSSIFSPRKLEREKGTDIPSSSDGYKASENLDIFNKKKDLSQGFSLKNFIFQPSENRELLTLIW
jgi:hypothetical protein